MNTCKKKPRNKIRVSKYERNLNSQDTNYGFNM